MSRFYTITTKNAAQFLSSVLLLLLLSPAALAKSYYLMCVDLTKHPDQYSKNEIWHYPDSDSSFSIHGNWITNDSNMSTFEVTQLDYLNALKLCNDQYPTIIDGVPQPKTYGSSWYLFSMSRQAQSGFYSSDDAILSIQIPQKAKALPKHLSITEQTDAAYNDLLLDKDVQAGLETLDIHINDTKYDFAALFNALLSMPQLKKLTLSAPFTLTDTFFNNIPNNLEHLSLYRIVADKLTITSDHFKQLNKLKQLTVIGSDDLVFTDAFFQSRAFTRILCVSTWKTQPCYRYYTES